MLEHSGHSDDEDGDVSEAVEVNSPGPHGADADMETPFEETSDLADSIASLSLPDVESPPQSPVDGSLTYSLLGEQSRDSRAGRTARGGSEERVGSRDRLADNDGDSDSGDDVDGGDGQERGEVGGASQGGGPDFHHSEHLEGSGAIVPVSSVHTQPDQANDGEENSGLEEGVCCFCCCFCCCCFCCCCSCCLSPTHRVCFIATGELSLVASSGHAFRIALAADASLLDFSQVRACAHVCAGLAVACTHAPL